MLYLEKYKITFTTSMKLYFERITFVTTGTCTKKKVNGIMVTLSLSLTVILV